MLRLQPRTLAVKSRTRLGDRGSGTGAPLPLAAASGSVWVSAGDRLYGISAPSAHITAQIGLGDANSSDLTASANGQQILVSEANGGFGAIELRSATTGALVASTRPAVLGVNAPSLSQVVDGGLWLSESTGMMGYIERLDVNTLTPTPIDLPSPLGPSSNALTAEVLAGVLYVQHYSGGRPARNYCGDPATGQMRAELALPSDATLLTASASYLYYIPRTAFPRGEQIDRRAINPSCLG